jgi:hypothetical protein
VTLKALRREEPPADPSMLAGFLRRMQDALGVVIEPLLRIPILDGVLLEDVELTTSFQDFPHGLGRKWRGFFVVKTAATTSTVRYEASVDESKLIRLRGGGAGTVSVWVF